MIAPAHYLSMERTNKPLHPTFTDKDFLLTLTTDGHIIDIFRIAEELLDPRVSSTSTQCLRTPVAPTSNFLEIVAPEDKSKFQTMLLEESTPRDLHLLIYAQDSGSHPLTERAVYRITLQHSLDSPPTIQLQGTRLE